MDKNIVFRVCRACYFEGYLTNWVVEIAYASQKCGQKNNFMEKVTTYKGYDLSPEVTHVLDIGFVLYIYWLF